MRKEGFSKFQVLNARYHEQEAYIVAQAGVPGGVTIATNMAGRGTDIQLGGNLEMRVERELGDVEPGPERDAKIAADRRGNQGAEADRRLPPAVSTSSRPNATKAAVSTTSCAAVPAVRATRAARNSTCRFRTT